MGDKRKTPEACAEIVSAGRRGMLRAYVLHSFGKGRKSGYDLLREIKEKTGGRWKPSKGALYPLITQLEKSGLLRVAERGKRGMKKYELSAQGRKALKAFREHAIHLGEHYRMMAGMVGDVFEGMDAEMYAMLMRARNLILHKVGGPKGKRVKEIIRKSVEELEKI
ncbi:MAG: PadR family transcriptional regulator [Candidatus Burarchaeum sp.]|nr:PadR family transcriptional regulator [Candidatus Burarchaeum sp.]MDO8339172.1 PadR family transcriptional regulator [Candidatus Burarchaeum sp.]